MARPPWSQTRRETARLASALPPRLRDEPASVRAGPGVARDHARAVHEDLATPQSGQVVLLVPQPHERDEVLLQRDVEHAGRQVAGAAVDLPPRTRVAGRDRQAQVGSGAEHERRYAAAVRGQRIDHPAGAGPEDGTA